MKALLLLILIVLTPFLWGCEKAKTPTGKIHFALGSKLFEQEAYAAAAEEYHKGVLLGSAVCRRGELVSLIMASGGTNTVFLAKAKASMELARSSGETGAEDAYHTWLRHVGAEDWEKTLKSEP